MGTLPYISTILPVSRGVQCVKEIISSYGVEFKAGILIGERESTRERQTDRLMVMTAHIVFSLCLECIIKLFSIHNFLLIMCSNPFYLLHCNFRNTIWASYREPVWFLTKYDSNMPAEKHAMLEICDFNAKTREFILYDERKTKALLSQLISDQIRLNEACADKIHAWIDICGFGTRTKQFIYDQPKKLLISLLISGQVRLKQACTVAKGGKKSLRNWLKQA